MSMLGIKKFVYLKKKKGDQEDMVENVRKYIKGVWEGGEHNGKKYLAM